MRALALAAALGVGGCATMPPPPVDTLVEPADVTTGTWRKVDAATGRLAEVAELEELARAFPDSGSVQVRLLSAYVRERRGDKAHDLVEAITSRGYRFSQAGEAQLRQFFADQGSNKLFMLSIMPNEVRVGSAVEATVPASVLLPESVLRERQTGRLYASSIVSRGLFRQDGKGGWEEVDLGATGSLSGMVQAPDGTIWIASGAYEPTPDPDTAYRGLIGYDPRSGKVSNKVAPAGATPSDIAIGPDGTLFAADPLMGAIYDSRPNTGHLRMIVVPGTFRSPQGMAVSGNGRFLYVSDYSYGLAVVDLRTGAIDRLPAPNSPFVDGTDGLWFHGGELIAIQNGARPMRIVAHRLAADGRSIVSSRVLEQANPDWTEPGAGSIAGDSLLYIGTGQWDRFGVGGTAVEGKPPLPTEVRRLGVAKKGMAVPKNPG
ncbi:hypothetical protein A6F68_02248 [Tsuneonella dongtanensis]|uniref:Virginiamycin B lyase n=1 Tax=Tsuneonella dongtanensis TaxID=692370 RepID=A0A1B2AF77_9SPHN|nr:hypothetical protein [Tsuneonella dongtanensis]ANY20748.1 hypothetical protein A6F68_02248 [Tsuneonella dongtanensis]